MCSCCLRAGRVSFRLFSYGETNDGRSQRRLEQPTKKRAFGVSEGPLGFVCEPPRLLVAVAADAQIAFAVHGQERFELGAVQLVAARALYLAAVNRIHSLFTHRVGHVVLAGVALRT